MQYVYCLKTKVKGRSIVKIGKTTRTPEQRLAEINESWAARGVRWEIAKVMTVWNCHAKEASFHREYRDRRFSSKEIRKWLGGRCDGDSEIFELSFMEYCQLMIQMGLDLKLGLVIGSLLGLLVVAGSQTPPPQPTQNKMIIAP